MFCLAMNDVTPIDPRHLQGSSPAVRVAQTLEGADPADQILLDLVHIISTGEYGRAFDRFLERMGKHYGTTRCYIFELDRDAGTCSNTYEWCDEGVTRLREDLGPVSSMGCTRQEFCANPLPLVEKADALMYEEKRRFYENLQNAVE